MSDETMWERQREMIEILAERREEDKDLVAEEATRRFYELVLEEWGEFAQAADLGGSADEIGMAVHAIYRRWRMADDGPPLTAREVDLMRAIERELDRAAELAVMDAIDEAGLS